MAMTASRPPVKPKKGGALTKERLWQEFFSDPSQWWDNRFDKKSRASPDFRHKHTKEVLWIEGWSNPSWVKTELSTMLQGQAQSGNGPNDDELHCGALGQEHNGMAALNEPQLFFGNQTGGRCSTSTIPCEKGPTEAVKKNSSGICAVVLTLCKAKQLKEALQILNQPGISADSNTYVCLLQECIHMKNLAEGKQVHAHIIQSGFKPNVLLFNTLVNMYARCGSMVDARQVFDKMPQRDMFTWSIMIAGYCKHGCGRDALEIYEQIQRDRLTPNAVIFTCVLHVCASLGALEKGREILADIQKAGIAADVILENTLLDMYAKCGTVKDARRVFDNMVQRDVISWSTMIAGYAQHGCGREAFEIYDRMIQEGMTPNKVTLTCILNACASLGALGKGKEVHAYISKAGLVVDIILETALVDMYAKCGSMKDARQVFDSMPQRNVVSWSAMMAGCAQHGCAREAVQLFEQMQEEGLMPDCVIFTSLLSACSHVGLVDEGLQYFVSMSRNYGLTPTLEHFGCMVDLLSRGGRLNEAEDFINKMPIEADASVWGAFLSACRVHGNVDLAQRAAKCLIKWDLRHGKVENVYAAAGRVR